MNPAGNDRRGNRLTGRHDGRASMQQLDTCNTGFSEHLPSRQLGAGYGASGRGHARRARWAVAVPLAAMRPHGHWRWRTASFGGNAGVMARGNFGNTRGASGVRAEDRRRRRGSNYAGYRSGYWSGRRRLSAAAGSRRRRPRLRDARTLIGYRVRTSMAAAMAMTTTPTRWRWLRRQLCRGAGYGRRRDDAYCVQRFQSYDPSSGTYLGYDGLRHPCP